MLKAAELIFQLPATFGSEIRSGTPGTRFGRRALKGPKPAVAKKTGPSYLSEKTSTAFVFRGENRHLSYWRRHSLPVVLVLHDPEANVSYWQSVSDKNVEKTDKAWKRAKRIGARLKLWSEPGTGTEAELTVPARIAYGKVWDCGCFVRARWNRDYRAETDGRRGLPLASTQATDEGPNPHDRSRFPYGG